MSSKDKPSKKAVKKKQEKVIEDSTFGLKNKNKSKKVQQFITRVEKSVKGSHGGLEQAKAKELKKDAKLAKQLQEEELRQLFNEAIGNQYGVKKSKAQSNAASLGLTNANKEVLEFLDNLSSDEDESDEEDNRPETIFIDDEPASGIEVFREKTIEDIIEEQRAKLAAEGKKGTPITAESFAKWRADKLAKKQAEVEARLKAESLKKKGGKGLSVLSGKELFSYNASLFVDDESAFDTTNDNTINAEIKALAEAEEKRIQEETSKAQEEQLRLAELQKVEWDVRNQKEQARRLAAVAVGRKTFLFNCIVINQVVFEDDEDEDLELFADEVFAPTKEENVETNETEEDALVEEMDTMNVEEEGEQEEDNQDDDEDNQDDEEEIELNEEEEEEEEGES